MKSFFLCLEKLLAKKQDVVLVTVVASSGSTPRGTGARMLVTSTGRVCGTIGGGAVEHLSEQLAMDALRFRCSTMKSFDLTRNQIEDLGMVCGGAVTVYYHFIPGESKNIQALAGRAVELLSQNRDLWLITNMRPGSEAIGIYSPEEGLWGMDAPEMILKQFVSANKNRMIENYFIERIAVAGRVLIFGCGHVSQALVPILSYIGFRCVAMDDRPTFANRELFNADVEVKLVDFERLSEYINVSAEDYVVIMTRGHRFDAAIQSQMLRTSARYIGVIGSAKKKIAVDHSLMDQGFTLGDIERIISPIGLDIKAETPAEIAVSIAGQLIRLRAESRI